MKFTLFLFFTFFGSISYASTDYCIKKSEVRAVAKHFKQFQSDLKKTNGTCFKSLGVEKLKLLKALIYIKDLGKVKPLQRIPQEDLTHTALKSGSWWRFLTSKVSYVKHDAFECDADTGAFIDESFNLNTIYTCSIFYQDSSIIVIASQLIHEARHVGDGQSINHHVECKRGPYAGTMGCDENIEDNGAYAFLIQFLVQSLRSPEKAGNFSILVDAFQSLGFYRIQINNFRKVNDSLYLSIRPW